MEHIRLGGMTPRSLGGGALAGPDSVRKAPQPREGPRAAKNHNELALHETLPHTLHSGRAEQHMHEGKAMFFPL